MGDEVEEELEAFEAVYSEDCKILRRSPPHVAVALKPGTAADISLQFVEAVLVMRANDKYPAIAPALELQDTKGLDDQRHAKLLSDLHAQVSDLSPGPMFVAIAEVNYNHMKQLNECPSSSVNLGGSMPKCSDLLLLQAAKDLLTSMNTPDGDCCFCMLPLVDPDSETGTQPFMKLMTCFHCFHSNCFGRWWRWLHSTLSSGAQEAHIVMASRAADTAGDTPIVQCPVCRSVVHASDIAHVRDYLMSDASGEKEKLDEDTLEVPKDIRVTEIARQTRFLSEFEAQKARGGIIEVKKLEVILPGMVLPPNPVLQPPEEPETCPPQTTLVNDATTNDSISVPTCVPNFTSSDGERRNRGHGGHERLRARRTGPPRGNRKHQNMSGRGFFTPSQQSDCDMHQVGTMQESNSLPESNTGLEPPQSSTKDNISRGELSSISASRRVTLGATSVDFEETADQGGAASSFSTSNEKDGRGNFRGNFRNRSRWGRYRDGQPN